MIATFFALAATASFDCSKAAHPVEHIICTNPAIAAKDGEAARLYREKLALVFDRRAFRQQQRVWQRNLRSGCQNGCAADTVSAAYDNQIAFLRDFAIEQWEANYKTADYSEMTIVHLDPKHFSFEILRGNVDDDSKRYCKIPESEADDLPVAELVSQSRATWFRNGCTLTFALKRDDQGDVNGIDLSSSPACRSWCADKRYVLDDSFAAGNDWTNKTGR